MEVALRVAERNNTYDLRKSGNFKEIPEMLGIDRQVLRRPPKRQF